MVGIIQLMVLYLKLVALEYSGAEQLSGIIQL